MRAPAAALAALLCALTACTGTPAAAPPPGSPDAAPAPPAQYVALGDSFTAGPMVPETDLAEGCLRSDRNYPSLLADRLELDLTDVSCSGAGTAHLTAPQPTVGETRVPAQLAAVEPDTDLVTVGIGGNDQALFASLVRTCLGLRGQDPTGSPCADSGVGRDLLDAVATVGPRVRRGLERVQRRAPDAMVVLVGYLRIAPSRGACPDRLPFADGDVAFGDRVMRALAQQLETAAGAAGAAYVDMYAASRGHDVCSDEPWVNGRRNQPGVAAAYHPTAAGMQAVADELADLLHSGS